MSDSLLKTKVIENKNESELCKIASTGAVPKKRTSNEGKPSKLETKATNKLLSEHSPLKHSNESKTSLKMSEDSLNRVNSRETPKRTKKPLLNFPDTDSCLSVSPSPDPDTKKKTFDFSMIDPSDKSSLTAALQTEQEFLDFMFSLPQIQKEAIDKDSKEKVTKKVTIKSHDIKNVKTEKKVSTKGAHSIASSGGTGFDHLDNLCRMMDQLGELKEQNTRLQRRVLYLEELKTLQEMHRDIQDSIASRKSALSLGSVSLSDSDLRLEDLTKYGYLLDSEESLDKNVSVAKNKDQTLELPDTTLALQRHSSSEDDRRGKEDTRRPSEKEKKGHKSAWGKVKHMISYNTKRENVRKKSTVGVENSHQKQNTSINKSLSTPSAKNHVGGNAEGTGVSDPEEYDLEYESNDPDGTSWDWDDAETGGIWMGPKTPPDVSGHTDISGLSRTGENIRAIKRNKPQLTITVPSNENLHNASRTANTKLATEIKCSPGSSPSKFDLKSSPEFSTSPPSPRRSSNWSKVKNAFLTGPIVNHHNHNSHSADQELHIGNRNRSHQSPAKRQFSPQRTISSQPPSPNKKAQLQTNFSFDVTCPQEESDSPSGISPEISPDDILLPNRHRHSKDRRRVDTSPRHSSIPSSVVHKNLIDLQKTLTGEFNKKLQEWEKLKSQQGIYGTSSASGSGSDNRAIDIFKANQAGAGDLPQDFKKKLHEWEKMKGREFKEKLGRSNDTPRIHVNAPLLHLYHHNNHQNHNHHHQNIGHEDLKTKIHDEDDLPPDFKKKLAEWEIRKALVGKGQQNVEQLQKNLGEEFNKKLAEWEKMKASSQGKITSHSTESSVPVTTESSSDNHTSQGETHLPNIRMRERASTDETTLIGLRENISAGSRSAYMPVGSSGYASQSLDRKGSGHKVKKSKSGKIEKTPMTKAESQKHRDKELLWLEKELHKIDREKQRLEREKEKFMEREARLEKMRHAMRQGPAEKKEIYIKTSTGEFRFEGISQTFTKKLYEWEERRGIRPESSTFVLLDPNYKAPEKEKETSTKNSPESKRITRSRSESSVVEMNQSSGAQATLSHQSSISLNEMDKEEGSLQTENKASSEPTLSADEEVETPKCAVLVQMEEELVEESDSHDVKNEAEREVGPNYQDPYAPAEITRLIDSSGSDDNLKSQNDMDDDVTIVSNDGIIMTTPVTFAPPDDETLIRGDSQRSEESYRSLLHENMTLLGKLKEQESLCRALETQMGDIDTKMDNVADQHLKTLEKLHRQVSIMKKSESSSKTSNTELEGNTPDDVESNERLIAQLKARIVELELKGDKLMEEKEELERAFKLHKSHETEIAESLLIRIRELQDAGAEVNIQTVQSQMDNTSNIVPTGSEENLNDRSSVVTCHEDEETETNDASVQTTASTASTTENALQSSPSTASDATSQTTTSLSAEPTNSVKKKRRKRRDEYCNSSNEDESEDDNSETEEEEDNKRCEKEGKDHQKRKRKLPPKKVQKLHSLTADLLFQAKRLEGALISRHNLPPSSSNRGESPLSKQPKKRSLKGRSSLRLTAEENKIHIQRKPSKGANANRTWSSIEAITSPDQEAEGDGLNSYESRAAALASESQDLLAMNAELSRMAKELRKEMLSVWSFRESTSPESNSSDTREETLKSKTEENETDSKFEEGSQHEDEKDEDNEWLKSEAKEIFDNIASLQLESPDIVEGLHDNDKDEDDSGEEKKLPETSTDSEKEGSVKEHETESVDASEIHQSIVESEEHFQSWWDVPFPKKRKNFTQQSRKSHSIDVPETNVESAEQSADLDSVIPGSSGTRLSDLLRMEKEKEGKTFIEDKETLNIRLSPFYNINSPRISRASSSTSDDERKDVTGKCFFTAEKEDLESANGTLNTNCSSTVKSDVLSSSFEYETKDTQTKHVDENECEDDFYKEQYEKFHEVHTPKSNTDFTPCQLSKVQEIVQETRMKIESDKELKASEKCVQDYVGKSSSSNGDKKFVTEVKSGFKTDGKIGGLRTRRVSDSQIFYMENQEGSLDESYGYQNDTNKYIDKPYKPATRTPSIRRNQSESDVLWLKEHQDVDNADNDPSLDIFVPTHRTIFTVTGTNDSFATEVIPTFLPDEDDDEDDDVCECTEKSLEYTDKDLSCETLKEDLSLSNDVNSESSQTCESKSKSNYVNENEDFEAESSDTQTKSLNEEPNLSISSRSITPFRSPPISPSFINAFCSSFHQNSPPVKSKKKVLEAANETSPTVKTMIDLYNKRITEKQEMLINPFKPGDPFTEKKYSNFNAVSKTNSSNEMELNRGRVLKSQSTSILPTYSTHNCMNIQRSISGTNEVLRSSKFYEFESGLPKKTSCPVNFKNSYVNIYGNDVSCDLDASTEDSLKSCTGSRVSSPHCNSENEKARSRASKLRRARNEFLSRGAAPLTSVNRLRDNYEEFSNGIDIDNLHSYKKVNTSMSNKMPSSTLDSTSDSAIDKDFQKVELRNLPVSRKESFRRQSESCLLDEFTIKSEVLKSASAGGIEYRNKQVQGRPPSNKENRKSSYDPADDKRSSKGIFKLFKKSRTRDRKDLSTVQELCKQSLAAVEITSPNRVSNISHLEQPSTSHSTDSEVLSKVPEGIRTSKTLPREEAPSDASASTSRSCPSSPEALRKSKTAQWLSVGKNIFKSRSSSPSKRPR